MLTIALVMAVVAVESGGRADAVSYKGAAGLTQMTPIGLAEVEQQYGGSVIWGVGGTWDAFDQVQSIRAGALLLRYYSTVVSNTEELLATYNGGTRQMYKMRAGGHGAMAMETQRYVQKVLETRLKIWQKGCQAVMDESLCKLIAAEAGALGVPRAGKSQVRLELCLSSNKRAGGFLGDNGQACFRNEDLKAVIGEGRHR